MLRATALAHTLIRQRLRPGDWAIDATLGKGQDAICLAECVGMAGRVFAFDPQAAAQAAARRAFAAQGVDASMVTFCPCGHETMATYVDPGTVRAVMFNLGYLPGGDQAYRTQTGTTLRALQVALTRMQLGGMLTVIVYPGHPGGAEEGAAVVALLATLPAPWKIYRYEALNTKLPAPALLVAEFGAMKNANIS